MKRILDAIEAAIPTALTRSERENLDATLRRAGVIDPSELEKVVDLLVEQQNDQALRYLSGLLNQTEADL